MTENPKYRLEFCKYRYDYEIIVNAIYDRHKEKIAKIYKRSRLGMYDDKKCPFWYNLTILKVYNAPPHTNLYNVAGSGDLKSITDYLNKRAFYKNGQWWFGEYMPCEECRPPKEQYSFRCEGCGQDYFSYYGNCMICECCGKKYRVVEDDTIPFRFSHYEA